MIHSLAEVGCLEGLWTYALHQVFVVIKIHYTHKKENNNILSIIIWNELTYRIQPFSFPSHRSTNESTGITSHIQKPFFLKHSLQTCQILSRDFRREWSFCHTHTGSWVCLHMITVHSAVRKNITMQYIHELLAIISAFRVLSQQHVEWHLNLTTRWNRLLWCASERQETCYCWRIQLAHGLCWYRDGWQLFNYSKNMQVEENHFLYLASPILYSYCYSVS
jgi:hypothetical protein